MGCLGGSACYCHWGRGELEKAAASLTAAFLCAACEALRFEDLSNTVARLSGGWVPPAIVERVVEAVPDEGVEFYIAPWQTGFTEAHSIKGKVQASVRVCATRD